jgi:hypothetical protein
MFFLLSFPVLWLGCCAGTCEELLAVFGGEGGASDGNARKVEMIYRGRYPSTEDPIINFFFFKKKIHLH